MNLPQILLLTILLSLPLCSLSQDKTAINKIGLNYSFDYSYRSLSSDESFEWLVELREIERPMFTYHAGIDYFHQFKSGLILESGFQYAVFGDEIPDLMISTVDDLNAGSGSCGSTYHYVGIPIKMGYGIPLGKRFWLSASSGISTNFYLYRQYKVDGHLNDGTVYKSESTIRKEPGPTQFEQVNFVSVSSIGIDFSISRAFSVRLEPNFSYFINPFMDAPIKQRPYSAGINTTFFYTLGSKKVSE